MMKESKLHTRKIQSRDGVSGKAKYGLEYLNGNSDSYFTLTACFKGKGQEFGGCCHNEIVSAAPDLKPFADLHLSDSSGVPMHAEENGWYWLAGSLGGLGEQ